MLPPRFRVDLEKTVNKKGFCASQILQSLDYRPCCRTQFINSFTIKYHPSRFQGYCNFFLLHVGLPVTIMEDISPHLMKVLSFMTFLAPSLQARIVCRYKQCFSIFYPFSYMLCHPFTLARSANCLMFLHFHLLYNNFFQG